MFDETYSVMFADGTTVEVAKTWHGIKLNLGGTRESLCNVRCDIDMDGCRRELLIMGRPEPVTIDKEEEESQRLTS